MYPVGVVWVEAGWAAIHDNRAEATRATLLQLAVSSVLSKKAQKQFNKQVKKLAGD
ncbi:hypothetical protein Q669_29440 [Labrenzia sp. C1B10]|nr:hypothetical protein Q669_29440 [Labrenzia sp. C1B10]ERS05761.1 hypothetical protein Q675_29005 [Labrenzia sp. C1B70]